jgi:hypothetical protein
VQTTDTCSDQLKKKSRIGVVGDTSNNDGRSGQIMNKFQIEQVIEIGFIIVSIII